MRYAALGQGANSLDRFGDFRLMNELPDPSRLASESVPVRTA